MQVFHLYLVEHAPQVTDALPDVSVFIVAGVAPEKRRLGRHRSALPEESRPAAHDVAHGVLWSMLVLLLCGRAGALWDLWDVQLFQLLCLLLLRQLQSEHAVRTNADGLFGNFVGVRCLLVPACEQ